MLTRPNFQRLLDVVKATEIQYTTVFTMEDICRDFGGGCGTAGCLIGNYNLFAKRPRMMFLEQIASVWCGGYSDWKHFGITRAEYQWLFCDSAFAGTASSQPRFSRDLSKVTKEQALSRLRKFIYYKLHKQEMILDDNGVREEARQTEGDHGFVNRAVAASKNLSQSTA